MKQCVRWPLLPAASHAPRFCGLLCHARCCAAALCMRHVLVYLFHLAVVVWLPVQASNCDERRFLAVNQQSATSALPTKACVVALSPICVDTGVGTSRQADSEPTALELSRWTPKLDDKLRTGVQVYGVTAWEVISGCIFHGTKSAEECARRWTSVSACASVLALRFRCDRGAGLPMHRLA